MPEKVALSNSSKSTMERANKAHKKALRKLSRTLLYNGTDDDAGASARLLLQPPQFTVAHAHALTPRLQQTATAQTAQWRRRRIRCLMKSCSEATAAPQEAQPTAAALLSASRSQRSPCDV